MESPPRRGFDDAPEAWVSLYRQLGERVFRLVHRMTGDADLASDLVHDTFVIAATRIEQYDGRGEMESWIFRIAANLVRERARTRRRRAELLLHGRGGARDRVTDESGPISTRLLLEDALARLPEEHRVTLLLHEVDGYTHAEIAAMMGVAEGSSRARLARAKAELRNLLRGRI